MRGLLALALMSGWIGLCAGGAPAAAAIETLGRYPAGEAPVSEPVRLEDGLSQDFCKEWNPEFDYQGYLCCPNPALMKKRGRVGRARRQCDPHRNRQSYCSEMTPEQHRMIEHPVLSRAEELLSSLERKLTGEDVQAQCGPNNGFLANGRPLLESSENHIRIRSPQRCTNFGTDSMVAMLDWLGRLVGKQYGSPEYQRIHLLVGDISAPRGGCLAGSGGRKGHASHTNGQDVDVSFLVAQPNKESPLTFHKAFDARTNWWVLKNVFENPYACVRRVFLDRKLIGKLARVAGDDPVWKQARPFIQHQKGHRNHFHIRLGGSPGSPGCIQDQIEDQDQDQEEEVAGVPASAES